MIKFVPAPDQIQQSPSLPQYKYTLNGIDYDIEFPYVTPETVDYAVHKWFNEDQPISMIEKEDKPKKIECIFSTTERWVMFQKHERLRDSNGILRLPIISLRRVSINPIYERTVAVDEYGTTNIRLYVKEYINPSSQQKEYIVDSSSSKDKKNIVEAIDIQPAKVCEFQYSVVFWSQFVEDLNMMIQHMVQNFSNKHAVYVSDTLWFSARLDSLNNLSNDEEIANGERVFKTDFTLIVTAPLIDPNTISHVRSLQSLDLDIDFEEAIINKSKSNEIKNKIDWYHPYKIQR